MTRSMVGRQLRRKARYPQVFNDCAVIARKPGERVDGFSPPFDEPYTSIACKYPRRLSIIDKVPVARPKLMEPKTKKPIRMCEKDVGTLYEIFKTYAPPAGNTLDGFGGTLTTALVCLKSGRPCVVVEKDKYCFDLAVQRLFQAAFDLYGSRLCMQSITSKRLTEAQLDRICVRVQTENDINKNGNDYDVTAMQEVEVDQDDRMDGVADGDYDDGQGDVDADDCISDRQDAYSGHSQRSTQPYSHSDKHGGLHSLREVGSQSLSVTELDAARLDEHVNDAGHNTETPQSLRATPSPRKMPKASTLPSSQRRQLQVTRHSDVEVTLDDCREHVLISPDEPVTLVDCEGRRMGQGVLAIVPTPNGREKYPVLRETIHGTNLSTITADYGPHAIMFKISIDEAMLDCDFEGVHVGTDDEPKSLRDIQRFSFYLWPLSQVILPDV